MKDHLLLHCTSGNVSGNNNEVNLKNKRRHYDET